MMEFRNKNVVIKKKNRFTKIGEWSIPNAGN